MKISEMIKLVGDLGIGESNLPEETNATFLKYLNLANAELHRETSSCNPNLFVINNISSQPNESSIDLLNIPNFILRCRIPALKLSLTQKTKLELSDYEFENPQNGRPRFYSWSPEGVVDFFPIEVDTSYLFQVCYIDEVDELKENTEEEDIPYPLSYHSVLVDGAIYYMALGEAGFRISRSVDEAIRRWEKGKKYAWSYFWSAAPNKINTFSSL